MPRISRPLLAKLGLSALSIVLGLCAVELTLRLVAPPPLRYRSPQPIHDTDPELGWTLRPNQSSFTIDKPVVTNSLGMRSTPEIPHERRPGRIRVLCIGDSQTFGNGVAGESTFASSLQAHLADAGVDALVLNAGVQAYDTVQEVGLLARLAPNVDPDVVVLAFYLNDIVESRRRSRVGVVSAETGQQRKRGWRALVPIELVYLVKRTATFTFIWSRYRRLASSSASWMQTVLQGGTEPKVEEGWAVVEAQLERAQALAEAGGRRLIVFPVPAAMESLASFPDERYRSRLMELTGKLGIESFDPHPELLARGLTFEEGFIPWDGHISAWTHDQLGELLARRIMGE